MPGALVALLLGAIAVIVLDLDQKGVGVIGSVPKGLPHLTYPSVGFAQIGDLLPLAAGLALVGFSEAVLTARAFGEQHGETVDANRELIALGIGNVGVGFTQGFPTSASQSRTAVAETSGMRTQLAQILAGISVAVFLLFFTGLLKDVPQVALAAIVIFAALGLFEERQLRVLYRADRVEFGVAFATFAGVVVFGILTGILIAVGLSLAVFLGGVVRPHDAVLGPVDGVDGFHEMSEGRNAEAAPGVVVYRFDGPLFFANADYFLSRALRLVEERPLRCFVLDLEAVTTVDVTAARAVEKLRAAVAERGATFLVARATVPLRRQLHAEGLADAIGEENFHPTVRTAVRRAAANDALDTRHRRGLAARVCVRLEAAGGNRDHLGDGLRRDRSDRRPRGAGPAGYPADGPRREDPRRGDAHARALLRRVPDRPPGAAPGVRGPGAACSGSACR